MYQFLSGLLVMGYVVSGTFFFKYWRVTRDRLFAWFAASFWILSLQRILLVVVHPNTPAGLSEYEIPFYCMRFLAYLLIVIAIIDKNRSRR
ncbi:MAG TPA: DUF5985 family protein [Capsulimonadaceae bacterium]|nr:DUF5985 family protein [Capsulimonadaceae bacterium]